MDVTPSRPKVFLLTEDDRDLVANGPALTDQDGSRHDLPPKVHEVLKYVEEALRQGYALQITPLRQELPIDEAAAAIEMSSRELRVYVSEGEIPFRSSEYVDWVRLADVLAFNQRLNTERRQVLDEMLSESVYDDDDDGPSSEQDR
jgi:hypothetical protein